MGWGTAVMRHAATQHQHSWGCLVKYQPACLVSLHSPLLLLLPTCVPCSMRQLVENGPHPPPGQTGARYIVRDDGTRMDLRYLRTERVRAGSGMGAATWME